MRHFLAIGEGGKAMHHYYQIDGLTDLAVIRDQANARTNPGGSKWSLVAEPSVIHFHKFTEAGDCTQDTQHEFYSVAPMTSDEMQILYWEGKKNA